MLVRRDCWKESGGLDPAIFLYAEELDWCYRIVQLGWKAAFLPGMKVVHHGEQTSSALPRHEVDLHLQLGQLTFFIKHYPEQWVRRYKRRRFRREVRGTLTHLMLSRLPGAFGRKHRSKYLAYACRLWYWLNRRHQQARLPGLLADQEARRSAENVFTRWASNRALFPDAEE